MITESEVLPTAITPQDSSDAPRDSDDLVSLQALADLFRRKAFLIKAAAVGTAIGACVALLLPTMYTATALIMLPTKTQSLAVALMGPLGMATGLSGSLGGALNFKDPADLYIGILKSRTTTDTLIGQFNLQEVYSEKNREDTRRTFAEKVTFSAGKDSMIRIAVEDRDPVRAAEMANALVADLYRQNTRLAITESAQRRVFFERSLEQEKSALAKAEDDLKATQQKTGVIVVSGQADATIRAIAQLRAEIAGREVSLKRLKMGATAQYPEVIKQEAELGSLRQELSRLESATSARRSGDPLIPTAQVPEAGLEYVRCLREVKYHEALFEVLAKQYEAARIDEAKESPAIQVVDPAVQPEKKSGPHRILITALATFLSLIAGVLYIGNEQTITRLLNTLRQERTSAKAVHRR
jgi:uncharacterized protein involved in exopolysaccharide biosynthesis